MSDDPITEEELQAFAHGRLAGDQADTLRQRIEQDPELRAQVAMIRQLADDPMCDHPFPGEFGWARLTRAMDAEDRRLHTVPVWQKPIPLWQAVAGVAAAFVLWQVGSTTMVGPSEGRYQTASGDAMSIATLRVRIDDKMTIGELNDLLQEIDAVVIDGPGASGLYQLSFVDEASRQAALPTLKAATKRVQIIE
ncbi:RNA polymerase sigma-70 factor [Parvularcula bermudensis HTCC2503]|uniref:RNA polymerase sigma-70 factor n=1 Tax=Parvularcula bermudensis (strain ATCC BAA-594 / HTCC2503 / KCTC 12087) TaxID=314260 RepID=E0TDF7_PARBH|nr:hypothetical protein [Parvularcula bermudensis]ADM10383.1 RNA polymerase sigma-70 factor [Parvularcula bermudensis HTCC2503]